MTLGLILCLILMVTAAAVLWSYQYLTIQNLELEYAARSAIQGAMADESAFVDALKNADESDTNATETFTYEPLNNILKLTAEYQNHQIGEIQVRLVNKDTNENTAVLEFCRPRKLGVFGVAFKEDVVKNVEIEKNQTNPNDTKEAKFRQLYQISWESDTAPKNVRFQKIYNIN